MQIQARRPLVTAASIVLAATALAGGSAKHRFAITGSYVEGCSCNGVCQCELTGVEMGCQGVGMFSFTGGNFDGMSLAGTRAAYATKPGDWVMIYIDAPASKRKAVEGLMRAALAGFGKIEAVKSAKVEIGHRGNADWASVDGGKIMSLKSTAVIGGDGKTPLTYSNIHDALHPTIMQGKTTSAKFSDGDKTFELKDSNAFFNHNIRSSGKL